MREASRPTLTTLDWLLVWLAVIGTASLLAMPITVTPTFRSLVADVGGELPRLSAWVFAGQLPVLAALPPAALLFVAWRLRGLTVTRRRLLVAAAAALAIAGLIMCLAGYAGALVGASDPHVGAGHALLQPRP